MIDEYICPVPTKWNEIYHILVRIWEEQGRIPNDKPPIPLILAAWHESNNAKKQRWIETIKWMEDHDCSHLILNIKEEEMFKEQI